MMHLGYIYFLLIYISHSYDFHLVNKTVLPISISDKSQIYTSNDYRIIVSGTCPNLKVHVYNTTGLSKSSPMRVF